MANVLCILPLSVSLTYLFIQVVTTRILTILQASSIPDDQLIPLYGGLASIQLSICCKQNDDKSSSLFVAASMASGCRY